MNVISIWEDFELTTLSFIQSACFQAVVYKSPLLHQTHWQIIQITLTSIDKFHAYRSSHQAGRRNIFGGKKMLATRDELSVSVCWCSLCVCVLSHLYFVWNERKIIVMDFIIYLSLYFWSLLFYVSRAFFFHSLYRFLYLLRSFG